jgi:beta-lactamase regulating signal transducer with metallopeptidase domain
MQPFWEIVASNSLLVVVLAAGVALLGRFWKNPLGLHFLWVLVLLKLVTPPVVTVPLPWPARPVSLASEEYGANRRLADQSRTDAAGQETASTAVGRDLPRFQDDRLVPQRSAPDLSAPLAAPRQGIPRLAVLGWVWGMGIVLFASGHAFRILRFRRLLHCSEAPSSVVLGMAEGIGRRLGLGRVPEIRVLPVCVSPLVWSLGGRPKVFLPAGLFERLDATAQEAILAHELAHVRRKDHWVRLLEVAISTLFWWHPVVWWATRQLQELEDQCCDRVVVDMAPHGARSYATALLDTLDFLSERPIAAPLGATAAKSATSLTRRIAMLKTRSSTARLTLGRLALLLAVAALPMALAFGQKPPEAADKTPQVVVEPARAGPAGASEQPVIERRAVNKLVKDFPEKIDLSTPEAAEAAGYRASARMDAKALCELSAWTLGPRDIEEMERFWKRDPKDTAVYNEAQRNAEILEVDTYRGDLAEVITKLKFPEGVGRDPYSCECCGKINGLWKDFGEDRLPSLEAARENFDRKKDNLWRSYVRARDSIKKGQPAYARADSEDTGARIAPGEPLGISVEKADLMGRVEWAMMHGARDITARRSIEWGEVQKEKNGNRSIRYKFYATIWDRDVYIMNMVFTFDAKGNILSRENVEGFPQKKVIKPADVSTQQGMKELVEDFFSKNFRDVTSRDNPEWGEVTKAAGGNSSIRYKYRARIWNKDIMIMNQVFTFDPKGKFVSVKDVEGFPQTVAKRVNVNVSTQQGMKELVEDFFSGNFRDITSREAIEWGEVTKVANGNSSIRYKYRAQIWGKEIKIMNQVFTFDPKGKFVSVKDAD